MSREKNYSTSTLDVDLDSGTNIIPIAQDVAIGRAQLVSESMCLMGAIRSIQPESSPSSSSALITCHRAAVQDVSAMSGQQAAHLLPGQISVNGIYVWNFADPSYASSIAQTELLRLKQQTKLAFAKTNVLPAIFNRADTEAEGTSSATQHRLKHEFGRSVGQLWKNSSSSPSSTIAIDRDAVIESLRHWFSVARTTYQMAAQRKIDRADSQSGKSRQRRELEARVLETYANSFDVKNVTRFLHARAAQVFMRYKHM